MRKTGAFMKNLKFIYSTNHKLSFYLLVHFSELKILKKILNLKSGMETIAIPPRNRMIFSLELDFSQLEMKLEDMKSNLAANGLFLNAINRYFQPFFQ